MGIVAGMLVQNTLKYLLNFGEVSDYLGYNALIDFFPKMSLKPNKMCSDKFCMQRQKEFDAKPKVEKIIEVAADEGPLHESNEFCIELVEDDTPNDETVQAPKSDITHGLRLAYEAPAFQQDAQPHSTETIKSDDISLDDLMAQMKSI